MTTNRVTRCVCGQLAPLKCGKCGVKYYCSITCQRSDWRNHKVLCGSLGLDVYKVSEIYNNAKLNGYTPIADITAMSDIAYQRHCVAEAGAMHTEVIFAYIRNHIAANWVDTIVKEIFAFGPGIGHCYLVRDVPVNVIPANRIDTAKLTLFFIRRPEHPRNIFMEIGFHEYGVSACHVTGFVCDRNTLLYDTPELPAGFSKRVSIKTIFIDGYVPIEWATGMAYPD